MGARFIPPAKQKLIWITKSFKDIMSLHQTTGYFGISEWGESIPINKETISYWKSRSYYLLGFMDNDKAGKALGDYYKNEYGIPSLYLPGTIDGFRLKDPNDAIKKIREKKFKDYIKTQFECLISKNILKRN
jgi:hypothetical protein